MFTYLLAHIDHKGPLNGIYLGAIEGLGLVKDPAGVTPLKEALYRGEWWAPRRTSAFRSAAAAALARIGTADAFDVLEEALTAGPRGVRSAVKPLADNVRTKRGLR
jgi:HEAT repeat protein